MENTDKDKDMDTANSIETMEIKYEMYDLLRGL
jgi:hypothetical protein